MARALLFSIALVLLGLSPAIRGAQAIQCAVCGMKYQPGTKTSFESVRAGKPVHFCSYSCARRFHDKYPDAPLHVWDFKTGAELAAESAFYLIRSRNLLKEIPFDMPPSVVAFASRKEAEKTRARLKDGEIVRGLQGLKKAYD